MTFCERFGMTPLEYAAQPADVILSWYQMTSREREANELRAKLDTVRRGRGN